jgi:hypothetical protein
MAQWRCTADRHAGRPNQRTLNDDTTDAPIEASLSPITDSQTRSSPQMEGQSLQVNG